MKFLPGSAQKSVECIQLAISKLHLTLIDSLLRGTEVAKQVLNKVSMKFNQKTKGLKAIAVMAIAVVGSFLTAGSAKAISFGFNGGLGATANFTIDGGNLILQLTNTGLADVNNPSQVLTGVFFDIA